MVSCVLNHGYTHLSCHIIYANLFCQTLVVHHSQNPFLLLSFHYLMSEVFFGKPYMCIMLRVSGTTMLGLHFC